MKRDSWLVIALISVAVLLLIPFLWDEHLTLRAKINYDKVASYFTIIAVLSTAASIYLLYRQTTIMHKEFLPDLHVEEQVSLNFRLYQQNDTVIVSAPGSLSHHAFTPQCKVWNHGSGVATDVSCAWHIHNLTTASESKENSDAIPLIAHGKSKPLAIPPVLVEIIKELFKDRVNTSYKYDSTGNFFILLHMTCRDTDNHIHLKQYIPVVQFDGDENEISSRVRIRFQRWQIDRAKAGKIAGAKAAKQWQGLRNWAKRLWQI